MTGYVLQPLKKLLNSLLLSEYKAYIIGGEGANFNIPSSMISTKHCVIKVKPNGVKITDLDSKFGTYLNGEKLEAFEPMDVKENDIIGLSNDQTENVSSDRPYYVYRFKLQGSSNEDFETKKKFNCESSEVLHKKIKVESDDESNVINLSDDDHDPMPSDQQKNQNVVDVNNHDLMMDCNLITLKEEYETDIDEDLIEDPGCNLSTSPTLKPIGSTLCKTVVNKNPSGGGDVILDQSIQFQSEGVRRRNRKKSPKVISLPYCEVRLVDCMKKPKNMSKNKNQIDEDTQFIDSVEGLINQLTVLSEENTKKPNKSSDSPSLNMEQFSDSFDETITSKDQSKDDKMTSKNMLENKDQDNVPPISNENVQMIKESSVNETDSSSSTASTSLESTVEAPQSSVSEEITDDQINENKQLIDSIQVLINQLTGLREEMANEQEKSSDSTSSSNQQSLDLLKEIITSKNQMEDKKLPSDDQTNISVGSNKRRNENECKRKDTSSRNERSRSRGRSKDRNRRDRSKIREGCTKNASSIRRGKSGTKDRSNSKDRSRTKDRSKSRDRRKSRDRNKSRDRGSYTNRSSRRERSRSRDGRTKTDSDRRRSRNETRNTDARRRNRSESRDRHKSSYRSSRRDRSRSRTREYERKKYSPYNHQRKNDELKFTSRDSVDKRDKMENNFLENPAIDYSINDRVLDLNIDESHEVEELRRIASADSTIKNHPEVNSNADVELSSSEMYIVNSDLESRNHKIENIDDYWKIKPKSYLPQYYNQVDNLSSTVSSTSNENQQLIEVVAAEAEQEKELFTSDVKQQGNALEALGKSDFDEFLDIDLETDAEDDIKATCEIDLVTESNFSLSPSDSAGIFNTSIPNLVMKSSSGPSVIKRQKTKRNSVSKIFSDNSKWAGLTVNQARSIRRRRNFNMILGDKSVSERRVSNLWKTAATKCEKKSHTKPTRLDPAAIVSDPRVRKIASKALLQPAGRPTQTQPTSQSSTQTFTPLPIPVLSVYQQSALVTSAPLSMPAAQVPVTEFTAIEMSTAGSLSTVLTPQTSTTQITSEMVSSCIWRPDTLAFPDQQSVPQHYAEPSAVISVCKDNPTQSIFFTHSCEPYSVSHGPIVVTTGMYETALPLDSRYDSTSTPAYFSNAGNSYVWTECSKEMTPTYAEYSANQYNYNYNYNNYN